MSGMRVACPGGGCCGWSAGAGAGAAGAAEPPPPVPPPCAGADMVPVCCVLCEGVEVSATNDAGACSRPKRRASKEEVIAHDGRGVFSCSLPGDEFRPRPHSQTHTHTLTGTSSSSRSSRRSSSTPASPMSSPPPSPPPPSSSSAPAVGSPCVQQALKKARLVLKDPVAKLRALPTIRERCRLIYAAAQRDELEHFALHEEKLGEVVDYVHAVIQERFPEGMDAVPNHSRYRHFEPGNVDRLSQLRAACAEQGVDAREMARRLVDLVVVSVLLDAGAGDKWKYIEEGSGQTITRSEGLGVASFHMFMDGAFSYASEEGIKMQADAAGLQGLTTEAIKKGFQVDEENNPLVGAEGRADLLRRLGKALEEHPEFFSSALAGGEGGREGGGVTSFRPGFLVDYLFAQAKPGSEPAAVSVHDLWQAVMYGLESIWPAGRTTVEGRSMGDVWPHSALLKKEEGGKEDGGKEEEEEREDATAGLVPFHKLSQWLTYSLLEPLGEAGLLLTETTHLTGLPEYRNGGLFVDLGVLVPKKSSILDPSGHLPDSEIIVEWRALTVVLLDEVAKLLRIKVGETEKGLPLVKVLEGGTWTAGRKIAKEKRPETCGPPIVIVSDGTVF